MLSEPATLNCPSPFPPDLQSNISAPSHFAISPPTLYCPPPPSLAPPHTGVQAPATPPALRRTMHFTPRPFPPTALANVPVEYIIDRLHSLAPHYWSKPETADCTIVIPLDSLYRPRPEQASRSCGSSPRVFPEPLINTEQKPTGDTLRPSPRMVMKLHADYLSSQSTLLRGLLAGVSPLDLLHHSGPATPTCRSRRPSHHAAALPSQSAHPNRTRLPSSTNLLPRILPSTPNHPTIYLPVPDPVSFRLLVHYMYFGSTSFIEDALDRGELSWEGLARNVEYLGLGVEVKVFLGRWYGRWKRGRGVSRFSDDDDEDEEEYSDSDDDDNSSYDGSDDEFECTQTESRRTSVTLVGDEQMDIGKDIKEIELENSRGRDRAVRRLGHACSLPALQTPYGRPQTPRNRSE